MIPEIKFRAMRGCVFGDTIRLYARTATHVATPPTMTPVQPGDELPALAVLNPTQAQRLMDDLWDCGVRPSEGTGSAGSLAATQSHLADLKTILFHQLKIK